MPGASTCGIAADQHHNVVVKLLAQGVDASLEGVDSP
jgi:hypothetical protein